MEKPNSSIIEKVFTSRNIYILLSIYALIYIASMWHRFIQIDENWFGEQAYYLVKEGVVKLKSMPGILDFDKQMFLYHKLLVFIGAIIIKSFGWSVYLLKFTTLFFYLIFFYVFYRYHRNNIELLPKRLFLITVFIIVTIPILIEHSFTFRPEIYVMTFGFLSYYNFDSYFKNTKAIFIIYAAIFSGLAFLITANGIIFPIAGFVFLIIKRKYKAAILYTLITSFICALFAWDLWQPGHLEQFIFQFNNWPTRKFADNYISHGLWGFVYLKIMSLINEHQRFFWSTRVMVFSALFILSFIVSFKKLRLEHNLLFTYYLALFFSLALMGSHKAEHYIIYLFPYMALITGISIFNVIKRKISIVYTFLIGLNLIMVAYHFRVAFDWNEDSKKIHAGIVSHIPTTEGKVFAPWKFIFNEINKYDFINYQAIQYLQDDMPTKMTQQQVVDLLYNKYEVRFMILDNDITSLNDKNGWFYKGIDNNTTNTRLIFKDSDYQIWEIFR